jgi:Sulfotransferase family
MINFARRVAELFRSQDLSVPCPEPMPIIVGSPRSGTTLLRLILDAHSELAIPPETGFLTISETLTGRGDKLREKFFDAVVNFSAPAPSWPDFEIPGETFRDALSVIEPFSIADGYRAFYQLYAARHGKPRWGDKTPVYCRHIKPIRRVLPEARFIHIIRDGRDAALSLRRMWFSPGWEIETQAAYWRDCVLGARQAGIGCPDYMEVRYEELVLNTRETLERVCAHVGLTYEDSMLSYYKHAPERLQEHKGRSLPDGTPLLTQEQRIQQQRRTTQPPDPTCVFAWKRSMDTEERERFQLVAGDLLKDLGYEV